MFRNLLVAGCVLAVCSVGFCYHPYGNASGLLGALAMSSGGPELPFDPNDYNFLVYDDSSGDDESSATHYVRRAMDAIGLSYTVCDMDNPVTNEILNLHDILIVGFYETGGDKSGLVTSVIENCITGRIILSGTDTDFHVVDTDINIRKHAIPFFIQEIDYILEGSGTGLLVCADFTDNFSWLPASWGVVANAISGENISPFTQDGLDSGIFDGLSTGDLSGWYFSYHNTFEEWGSGLFSVFELGYGGQHVVTIGTPVGRAG